MSTGLEFVLSPKSIAVIGASNRKKTIGGELFRNLLRNEFQGPVYPVHPKEKAIFGVKAYSDISSIEDEVDLAVLIVAQHHVLKIVEDCGKKGVKALIIITAGFKEVGGQGIKDEENLKEICHKYNMRLVGPNCLGVLNTDPKVSMDASFAPTFPPAGSVAMATQSGALGVAMLDAAKSLNIGISDFVSIGNNADVSANDLLEHWGEDDRTKVILLYLESFGDAGRFSKIAKELSKKKPIVAVKSGRSKRGLMAANSHTGSLSGGDSAVDALVQQCGLIRVDTVEELFDMGAFLAHQPLPKGKRVAILTNAGGPGIMCTDACESAGLQVNELSDDLKALLAKQLPAAASVHNPVDMIASGSPEQYEFCARELLASNEIDALIALFVPPIITDSRKVAEGIAKASIASGKPVVACFMGKHGVSEATGTLEAAHIPSFPFPEAAVSVLSKAYRFGKWRSQPESEYSEFPEINWQEINEKLDLEQEWVSEDVLKEILTEMKIKFPKEALVKSAEEAVSWFKKEQKPCVLKMIAEGVSHKSDIGGVKINLQNEVEIEKAYKEIEAAAQKHGVKLSACLLQEYISGGIETIVGLSKDYSVGSLLMFGLGGVQVELQKDVSFRIPPLNGHDVHQLIRSIRAFPLLDGYRGTEKTDIKSLEEVLAKISVLATKCPQIKELDINPLRVLKQGEGTIVLDFRIFVE